MFYLAIESSCDETSIAILEIVDRSEFDKATLESRINQIQVISSIISSQIDTHAQYGGVVPEVGARLHAEQIHGLYQLVLDEALLKLGMDKNEFYSQLEFIFVTAEPGLTSALRVGIEFAKSLQFYFHKNYGKQVQLEFVNHLQGHVASSFYDVGNNKINNDLKSIISNPSVKIDKTKSEAQNETKQKAAEKEIPPCKGGGKRSLTGVICGDATQLGIEGVTATDQFNQTQSGDAVVAVTNSFSDSQIFPHLHLLISGGNTQIRLLQSWSDWEIVGQTIDDAAGECFDKAARMVGIPYPGGATLSKIAGDQYCNPLDLPIAMLNSGNLNLSLSGLKTAVRYKIQKAGIENLELDQPLRQQEIDLLMNQSDFEDDPKLQFIKQICISTQFAIVEQIKRKIDLAVKQHQPHSIGISGGVSANQVLITQIQNLQSVQNLEIPKVFQPDLSLTGDNAIMIGLAGLIK